jgi:hypothetical protein
VTYKFDLFLQLESLLLLEVSLKMQKYYCTTFSFKTWITSRSAMRFQANQKELLPSAERSRPIFALFLAKLAGFLSSFHAISNTQN